MNAELLSRINNRLKELEIEEELTELPKSLFKYEKIENGYSLLNLRECQTYLNSADSFNDPFDTVLYAKLIKNLEEINEQIKGETFASCYSSSSVESNILMWSHYANNHEGFCIEYDFESFINHIEENYEKVCMLPIFYKYKMADLSNIPFKNRKKAFKRKNEINKILLIKNIDWKYEAEWRIIAKEKGSFQLPSPKAIYLGVKMNDGNKGTIIKIAQKINVPVYKMLWPKGKEYKLDKELIWTQST